MNILEKLAWRYATKEFDNQNILPEDKIEILAQSFNLTATSYGLQPIQLKIVQSKELQKQMQAFSMNQVQVSTASHILVFCIENELDEDFINNYFEIMRGVRGTNTPEIDEYNQILIDRFSSKAKEEIKLWSTKQAYIALGNLMTVCAIEGIDACPMEGFLPKKIDELLNLTKENLSSVLMLPVGKRAKSDSSATSKKVRRPLKSIVERIT